MSGDVEALLGNIDRRTTAIDDLHERLGECDPDSPEHRDILNQISILVGANAQDRRILRDLDDPKSHVVLRVEVPRTNDYHLSKRVDEMVEFLGAYGDVFVVDEVLIPR